MDNETDYILFDNNFRNFSAPNLVLNQNQKVLPDIFIWVYVGVVCFAGLILNIMVIRCLLRSKCNGILYFLLQISFCDILTLIICPLELLYMTNRLWTVSPELCPVYMGIDSFTSTAVIYFIIAINLHSISTYNLAIKTLQRLDEVENQSLSESQDEEDDNYEVAINMHKRSLTIDYSKKKNSVSVIIPTLFIWFLAASISFPFFIFSSIIPSDRLPKSKICGVVNLNTENNFLMQSLVLITKIIIPTTCLYISSVYVVFKLYFSRSKIRPCGLEENVSQILKLSLIISIFYILFSGHKIYSSYLFEILSKPFANFSFSNIAIHKNYSIYFSMVYYALPCLRPLIYFFTDENLRKDVRSMVVVDEKGGE